jgi:hypothetical protein
MNPEGKPNYVLIAAGLSTSGKRVKGGPTHFMLRNVRQVQVPFDIHMGKIIKELGERASDHALQCTRFIDSVLTSHYTYEQMSADTMSHWRHELNDILNKNKVVAENPSCSNYWTFPISETLHAAIMSSSVLRSKIVSEYNERLLKCGSMGDSYAHGEMLIKDFIKMGCITHSEREQRIEEILAAKGICLEECDYNNKCHWKMIGEVEYEKENNFSADTPMVWTICFNNEDVISRAKENVITELIKREIKRLQELKLDWEEAKNYPLGARETISEWKLRLKRAVAGEDLQEDNIVADFNNPMQPVVQESETGVPSAESIMNAWKGDKSAVIQNQYGVSLAQVNPALATALQQIKVD